MPTIVKLIMTKVKANCILTFSLTLILKILLSFKLHL